MEHGRYSGARRRTRSLDLKLKAKASADVTTFLPNIENLITYGEITLGVLRPVGCVATAADEDNCLAMLVRRRGETLAQFLMRLDQAIDKVLTEGRTYYIAVDEVEWEYAPLGIDQMTGCRSTACRSFGPNTRTTVSVSGIESGLPRIRR